MSGSGYHRALAGPGKFVCPGDNERSFAPAAGDAYDGMIGDRELQSSCYAILFSSEKVVFGYGLFGKSVVFVVLPTKQREAKTMASISISDLYQGEGPGKKYGGILSAVLHEMIRNGTPEGIDERTWTEQLIVKHTFLIAKKMAEQGDVVSELTDAAPPSATGGKGRLRRRRPIRVTPPWSEKEDES